MTDQTERLEPCPFCGGQVQHRHALWPIDGDTDSVMHIESSGCGLVAFSIGTADDGVSVAAAWNTRAVTTQAAEIERLRFALTIMANAGPGTPASEFREVARAALKEQQP